MSESDAALSRGDFDEAGDPRSLEAEGAAPEPASGDPGCTAWLDRFFRAYHARRPVNATFIGVHEHDHALPDFSESEAGHTLGEMAALLKESADLDETCATWAQRTDLALARGYLRTQLWEFRSRHFHRGNPSLYTGEAAFGIISLFLTDFAPPRQRAEAAVSRTEAIPGLLKEARANIQEAPLPWTLRAIRECDGLLNLLTDGAERLQADAGVAVPGFGEAAERAASAVADHRVHLESELLDRDSDGFSSGEEALDLYLRAGHFLEMEADEIAAYALDQLAEARARLKEGASEFGARTPEGVLDRLAGLHPDSGEYYSAYPRIWGDMKALAEDRRLLTWPDFPIRYVPRPRWVRSAAPYLYFLFYRSPAAFSRPPEHEYLVSPLERSGDEATEEFLRSHNYGVIKLNHVIHHGGIGHHVQNWHAFRAESRVGRMAAVDCASRIAMFCGGTMAEGWACYATDLMAEAGALTDLERYAELQSRARMAARAVVDVRLHQGRMSLDEAAEFYEQNAGMSPVAAHAEAVKNSMFPGAAMMYVMGTDAIHDLRAEMSARLGDHFDLHTFHDRFLSFGSIPVSLIAREMLRQVEEGGWEGDAA